MPGQRLVTERYNETNERATILAAWERILDGIGYGHVRTDAPLPVGVLETRTLADERDEHVERLERELDGVRVELDRTAAERDRAVAARDEALDRVRGVLGSTSWRVTSPLRRLRDRVEAPD